MTDAELSRRFERLDESMRDMQTEMRRGFEQSLESTRDMQTEILRGLERFARGQFLADAPPGSLR
jgi:hypothetical protein